MILGCYHLALECECGREASYTGEKGSTCRADARRDGWRLDMEEFAAQCGACRGVPRRVRQKSAAVEVRRTATGVELVRVR